jgi:predicted MPP superfamily phosphohydrolase
MLSNWLFAAVALLVLYGMHHYFWARAIRDLHLAKIWSRGSIFLLSALGGGLIVAFLMTRISSADGSGRLALPVWWWLGFLFYALLHLILADLWWLARRALHREDKLPDPPVPSRRVLFRRVAAGVGVGSSSALAWVGDRNATGEITTPEQEVRLERLPKSLEGFRVVQLSDVHIGPLLGASFLTHVVEKTNSSKPDLIVITGDLVDGTPENLRHSIEPLFRLKARHGVHFVTGNHEYYSGAQPWIEYLRARGIIVLHNERVPVGQDRHSFDLAGIPDHMARRMGAPHAPDLDRALAGRDPERELLLLAHQPIQIDSAAGKGVGLQLSGHTHGGQIWPFGALVLLAQPYLSGLNRHGDGTQVYVSRGTGFFGPPMRIGAPAEISNLILRT